MAKEESRILKYYRKFRLFTAFFLVYATYNPDGERFFSYFHWAIKPWYQGFTKGNLAATGPHSIKTLIGLLLLLGWYLMLRATRRKIGLLGIFIALGIFGAAGWVMTDYGLINPNFSSYMLTHAILLVTSFILMLGILLPDPQARGPAQPGQSWRDRFRRKPKEAPAPQEAKAEAKEEASEAKEETGEEEPKKKKKKKDG